MSIPKAKSPGEEGLARDLQCYKVLVVREYRFDKARRWKFDFAIPSKMIGIEVEGGSWTNGRHNRGSGMAADCIKYNTAVLRGWRVLRFTTDQVITGLAIDTILQAME
jgi:very-short-patch-repair endonuclease